MVSVGDQNLAAAIALVEGMVSCGLAHAVLSPGSRSTPLALACLRQPQLRTRVAVDERAAAFFALGIARASGLPAAVVATSGSAPAHWYPAVIEADAAAVPMVLVSADRPPELVGWGANQTTDQAHLFGGHVRAFHGLPPAGAGHGPGLARAMGARCVEESLWPAPGPVHLNVAFREPLVPTPAAPTPGPVPVRRFRPPSLGAPAEQVARVAGTLSGRRGVVVCGPAPLAGDAGQWLVSLAEALDCPLLADPASGLRFGTLARERVLARYDAFLRGEGPGPGGALEWVLQVGPVPVSRVLQEYLARNPGAELIAVDASGRWPDPQHRAGEWVRADPRALATALLEHGLAPAPPEWAGAFLAAEARAAALAGLPGRPAEADVVAATLAGLPAGATLFCGNSLPVRLVDTWSGTAAKPVTVLASRGVSGIDGQVSTMAGLAAAGACPVVGLVGDLALYHDMNGLALVGGLPVVVVVLSNGGGGIFEYLPQAGLPEFERGWLAPLGLDLARVAALYGIAFHRVETSAGLARALAEALAGSGPALLEVMIDRREGVARHRDYWARVQAAPGA